MAERIVLDDIQGNILNGYGFEHVAHFLLHAGTAEAARRCLAEIVDKVTTAAIWSPDTPSRTTTLNVAVTYSGFERLGVPARLLAKFPEAFRQGPRDRAADLGDVGPSSPDRWDAGLGTGEVHLMLTVNARTGQDLPQVLVLPDVLERVPGLRVVTAHVGDVLPRQREHFGYADGFAQPDIEGVDRRTGRGEATARGGGVPVADSGWQPLKIGEFVLGYPDEDGWVETRPRPDLVRNGTYVVYRTLKQDVARFRQGLQEAAERTGLPEELVAAKVVGRWRDGMPLELSPHRAPGPLTEEADPAPPNDFRYLPHDRDGAICPLGAHIRRANPRDALDFDGTVRDSGVLTGRHRIIRRGLPYGTLLPPGAEDDGVDRGLLFVCFNADIARQFETVQGQWCNDGDAFGLGDDRDYVLGDTGGTGKMTIPVRGGPPVYVDVQPEIVLTRGAEYLFAPGITTLRLLADGAFD